jgi:glucose/arabinose dehydrogenase
MKRLKLAAAAFALVALGVAIGGAAALRVLHRQTGQDFMARVNRFVNRARGEAPPPPGSGWVTKGAKPPVIEVESSGWDGPIMLSFPAKPPESDSDIKYYVAEMGGRVRYKTRGGEVGTLVEGLLNYEHNPLDEIGLMGLEIDESTRSAFITLAYLDEELNGFKNRVERFTLSDDGKSASDRTVLLDMTDEETVPSYCIHFVAVGPDDMLYVGVGSGGEKTDAIKLDRFAGKVLRMTKDGKAPSDNPFFDPAKPDSPRSYIYASGFRNPFDLVTDPTTGAMIVSDIGPGIDRIVRLQPGVNYCFADSDDQMRANALYTWGPTQSKGGGYAPVGLAITHGDGLSDKPTLYVGLYGSVQTAGPTPGKRVLRFDFNPDGFLDSGAQDLVVYDGQRFSSVVDVEAGPDGLYFTDLLGESNKPHTNAGLIYRLVPATAEAPAETKAAPAAQP